MPILVVDDQDAAHARAALGCARRMHPVTLHAHHRQLDHEAGTPWTVAVYANVAVVVGDDLRDDREPEARSLAPSWSSRARRRCVGPRAGFPTPSSAISSRTLSISGIVCAAHRRPAPAARSREPLQWRCLPDSSGRAASAPGRRRWWVATDPGRIRSAPTRLRRSWPAHRMMMTIEVVRPRLGGGQACEVRELVHQKLQALDVTGDGVHALVEDACTSSASSASRSRKRRRMRWVES